MPLSRHVDRPGSEPAVELSLAQVAAGWPLAASLALLAARGVRTGRRRSALNECLHELRRPLQALALTGPVGESADHLDPCLRMAAEALERLEHEINGAAPPPLAGLLAVEPLLRAAVGRSRPLAFAAGVDLELGALEEGLAVVGDESALGRALDNLIANAVEHGGATVRVEARRRGGWLQLVVTDSGGEGGAGRPRRRRRRGLLVDLSGRRRRGHGLVVVRRVAAEHSGEFRLRIWAGRTEAVLGLPAAGAGSGAS